MGVLLARVYGDYSNRRAWTGPEQGRGSDREFERRRCVAQFAMR